MSLINELYYKFNELKYIYKKKINKLYCIACIQCPIDILDLFLLKSVFHFR